MSEYIYCRLIIDAFIDKEELDDDYRYIGCTREYKLYVDYYNSTVVAVRFEKENKNDN